MEEDGQGEGFTTGAEQSTISAYHIKDEGAAGGDGGTESTGVTERCLMSYAISAKKKKAPRASELLINDHGSSTCISTELNTDCPTFSRECPSHPLTRDYLTVLEYFMGLFYP